MLYRFAGPMSVLDSRTTAFEAADVHRSASAPNPYTWMSGGVLRGARYDLRKATMLDLIRTAYGVEPETVLGGPAWLEFDRFDIAAKAPPSTRSETIRQMLQTLLADRFKLVLHKDTRPLPVFALAMGKGKPKLRETEGEGAPECQYQAQPGGSNWTVFNCRHITMEAFAKRVRSMAGDYLTDPVIDSTGFGGAWDFELQWNARSQVLPGGEARTTIFDAIDRQLGLTLTLQKTPAPVLVIDRVNEKPTANAPGIAQLLPLRELEFEVADLKMSRPDEKGCCFEVTPGGGLTARAMPLKILLSAAWDVDWDHTGEKMIGVPKWSDSALFDINAKASTATNGPPLAGPGYIDDDVRLMLRALLIDRFRMKTHYEDRLTEAWTLAAVKPKLTRADPANRANCKEARTVARDPRDLNPKLSRLVVCQNVTMAQFASQLQAFAPDEFAYEVADATGDKVNKDETWDLTLSFTPSWQLRRSGGNAGQPADDGRVASDPDGGVSLQEAIIRQLGLKLEKRKRMLPVLVIDRMEEKPAEN
jgi:uncharacterized protein (TIGR03435 family)